MLETAMPEKTKFPEEVLCGYSNYLPMLYLFLWHFTRLLMTARGPTRNTMFILFLILLKTLFHRAKAGLGLFMKVKNKAPGCFLEILHSPNIPTKAEPQQQALLILQYRLLCHRSQLSHRLHSSVWCPSLSLPH